MAAFIGETEEENTDWHEFCDKQIQEIALEFAQTWKSYIASVPHLEIVQTKELIQRFLEVFPKHFENAIGISDATKNDSNLVVAAIPSDRALSGDDILDTNDDLLESSLTRVSNKPFLLHRLSFKLRKGKSLFLKQNSDEVELSPYHDKQSGHVEFSKLRNVKVFGELLKEGSVQYLAGDTHEGRPRWIKCRLVLIKVTAGYMLELYSPPKQSSKPRNAVFCFTIFEVRETTDLEMPDLQNTFVIKADFDQEWVLEAQNHEDMKLWLSVIISHCCLPLEKEIRNSDMPSQLYRVKGNSTSSALGAVSGAEALEHPPDLPPRLSGSASVNSQGNIRISLAPQRPSSLLMNGETRDSGDDFYSQLADYPWFHGMLSRCDAAAAVLHDSVDGHGIFLVRQSETRKGEYVLTFNYQGRAKHLRIQITTDSSCRVQHMSFDSIFNLLEYFRENNIPLESGGSSDVMLTEFVISQGNNTRRRIPPIHGTAERRAPDPPDMRIISTHGGSVRLTSALLEREQYDTSNSGGSTGRAVENTYMYT